MSFAYVSSLAEWNRIRQILDAARLVAISVEDSSLHAYRQRICLVQALIEPAEGEAVTVVIDPIATETARPQPMRELFMALSPSAEIVIHGGAHAVSGLKDSFGHAPPRLWDTQEAAVLLGLPATGYRSLCTTLLAQAPAPPVACDWRARPLAEDALESAIDDVRWLPALWRALSARIAAHDLVDEWREASSRVLATTVGSNRPDRDNAWRTREARALPPDRRPLFAALLEWREGKAREFDIPPGRVIANGALARLAGAADPAGAVLSLDAFHSRLMWSDREALRLLCVAADQLPAPLRTRRLPLAEDAEPALGPAERRRVRARLSALKAWRRAEANARGIGLQGVLPGEAMQFLARHGAEGLDAAPGLGAARRARYGATLCEVLAD